MADKKAQPTKVITGKVRFSYAHVFKPWAGGDEQEPKFSVCLLIDKKDKATLKKIRDAVEAVKAASATVWGGKVPANLKLPLRDGDVEREDQDEYKGCYFLNASSRTPPGVVDAQCDPIIDLNEFYSGCYGRASINFYAFSASGNKGVACALNHLKKTEDGENLGGTRSKPEDDFADEDDLL